MKGTKSNEDELNSGIPNKVSERIHHFKRAIADYLNDKINRLSDSQKKMSFLIFGLMLAAIFLLQILQSLQNTSQASLTIDQITVPKVIRSGSNEEKAQHLKHLLDSLRATKRSTQLLDSLVHARPGLMDSVSLFLHNYQPH